MTRFLLNGAPRDLPDIEPGRTVLDHLRLHERLTATKEGCAEGDCGACTIAIGRPRDSRLEFAAVNACIMLARDLDGCAAVTAEGLADAGVLAPAQEAMVELHGSQCGFCTPGFVMSLFALLQQPPPPDKAARREAVLDALAGNLCRCTGYRPILAAAEATPWQADARSAAWLAALQELAAADDTAPCSLPALDAALAAEPHAKLTGGATDLGVPIAKHGLVPPRMISLRQVEGLDAIEEHEDHLHVGASARYADILPHLQRYFPSFAALVRRLGSQQIRNLGTMGGNVCNASPIGDSAPCLIALNAVLTLRGAAGERDLPIDHFFTGYRKTALQPGEYLRAIKIPFVQTGEQFFAYKLAKRFDQDISTVAAGFKIRVEGGEITTLRAGFGGMAATPLRVTALEDTLIGQPATPESFAKAGGAASTIFKPLSDVRASAAYRLAAAAGFLVRLGVDATQAGATQREATDIWALA